MGSLAFWGGIAGAAKGAQTAIEMKEERNKADFDAAREERILALRNEMETEHQQRGFEQQTNITGMEIASEEGIAGARVRSAAEIAAGEQEFKADEGETERTWKTGQNQADRASNEKIANIRAAAANGSKKAAKDFSTKVQAKPIYDKNGIMTGTEDVTTLTLESGPNVGQTLVQEGEFFVKQGTPGQDSGSRRRVNPAKPEAVAALFRHPEGASHFFSEFHYLPAQFLPYILKGQEQNNVDSGGDDEDDE